MVTQYSAQNCVSLDIICNASWNRQSKSQEYFSVFRNSGIGVKYLIPDTEKAREIVNTRKGGETVRKLKRSDAG